MVGSLKVGVQSRQTHIRFRNIDDYESCINSIDEGYDAEDAIFNGYIYKLNTPQLNQVNRSQYGIVCNFKQQIIEHHGNNCYSPSNGYCFINCIIYLTKSDYKEQHQDFIRSEQSRSNIMTYARIKPCLRKLGIELGCFDGTRISPRKIAERNKASFFHINHFCLIWKFENVSFNQAVKELKDSFKLVDNYITEENVNS